MGKCLCQQMAGPDMKLDPTCLGNLDIFSGLEPEEMEALASRALRRRYEPGQAVFSQGQAADHMFLIKAGRVKLTKLSEAGDEVILDIRGGGDVLGENLLNSEGERFPVSAVCLEPTLTCGFSQAVFEKLVLAHPAIGLKVIKNLSRRIDRLTQRVGSMSATHLEQRLYQVLLQVAQEHGRQASGGLELPMPFTHEELSFLVGAHRVSITRALKGLKEAGKVVQRGKSLVVAVGGAG
ncbi:MAG: Crp/Fnr family transcriptional regulator [Desulfarculaceae bacterium]|nr:Crp/Fnr family transcriptional regulator [Desulfarculaceae bacterium]